VKPVNARVRATDNSKKGEKEEKKGIDITPCMVPSNFSAAAAPMHSIFRSGFSTAN